MTVFSVFAFCNWPSGAAMGKTMLRVRERKTEHRAPHCGCPYDSTESSHYTQLFSFAMLSLTFRKVFCLQAGCIKIAHDIDMKTSVASFATTTISRLRIGKSSGSLGIIHNSKFILTQ